MNVNSVFRWIVPVVLAGSLAGNVLLSVRLRSLQGDRVLTAQGPVAHPHRGDVVLPLHVKQVDGVDEVVDWGGANTTLIYYFNPSCGPCNSNGAAFHSLVEQIRKDVRVLAYTADLDGVERFRSETRLDVPLITDGSDRVQNVLKLNATPATLLIDASGHVVRYWEGAYTGEVRARIQDFLHVNLANAAESGGE